MIRLEHMALGFELGSELAVVIDAAVEDDGDEGFVGFDLGGDDWGFAGLVGEVGAEGFAVVDHGLVAAGVVDDAEPAVDECDVDDGAVFAHCAIAEAALGVGAAVFDGFVEDVEPGFGDGL
tara:strand:+ start:13971 stop:14333 length:363 start_codon:yes stop_codon:yes gene_type:complete